MKGWFRLVCLGLGRGAPTGKELRGPKPNGGEGGTLCPLAVLGVKSALVVDQHWWSALSLLNQRWPRPYYTANRILIY